MLGDQRIGLERRYGALRVLRKVGTDRNGHARYEFKCDCGVKFEAIGQKARKGFLRSCNACALPEHFERYKQWQTETREGLHKLSFDEWIGKTTN